MGRRPAQMMLAWLSWAGGAIGVCGGIALALAILADPAWPLLPRLKEAWILTLGGLVSTAILLLVVRVADSRAPEAAERPRETPVAAPRPSAGALDARTALQQMQTYIGVEVWDLALEKAKEILRRFPGTPEAEAVAREINDLQWKAEPKPAPSASPQEESRRMLLHAQTFMDLEMWDRAGRQLQEILRKVPGTEEAAQASRMLDEIGRKRPAGNQP